MALCTLAVLGAGCGEHRQGDDPAVSGANLIPGHNADCDPEGESVCTQPLQCLAYYDAQGNLAGKCTARFDVTFYLVDQDWNRLGANFVVDIRAAADNPFWADKSNQGQTDVNGAETVNLTAEPYLIRVWQAASPNHLAPVLWAGQSDVIPDDTMTGAGWKRVDLRDIYQNAINLPPLDTGTSAGVCNGQVYIADCVDGWEQSCVEDASHTLFVQYDYCGAD